MSLIDLVTTRVTPAPEGPDQRPSALSFSPGDFCAISGLVLLFCAVVVLFPVLLLYYFVSSGPFLALVKDPVASFVGFSFFILLC